MSFSHNCEKALKRNGIKTIVFGIAVTCTKCNRSHGKCLTHRRMTIATFEIKGQKE